MNTVAEAIRSLIGEDALAAVSATDIQEFDDIDTPGLQFTLTLERRTYSALVTLQPTGLYMVYVYDPNTMETKTTVPMVHGEDLATVIEELGR